MLPPDEQLLEDPGEALDLLDGLMLAGGADIDPATYGEQAHAETVDTVPERDRFEIALVRARSSATFRCSGSVAGCSSSMWPMAAHSCNTSRSASATTSTCACPAPSMAPTTTWSCSMARLPRAPPARPITRPSPTTIRASTGSARACQISGSSSMDGLPEAIEMPDRRFVLGVQWHPEADETSRVVGALVAEATQHMRERMRRGDGRIASYTPRPVRSRVIRTAAWGVVAVGVLAPLVRKRLSTPPLVAQTVAFAAPVGLCVAVPRSRTRDVAVCCLQMWAYLAAYKAPNDDEAAQEGRVLVDYPIAVDRVLGLGELPTVRLQRRLARGQWRLGDRVLVWAHWLWFMVPHGSLVYIMLRHRSRFDRSAVLTYAVFDIGAIVYWILPTAPPWYAAAHGSRGPQRAFPNAGACSGATRASERAPQEIAVRRMMVEYGEYFWKDGWGPLYSVFGGNPLAAMPSLHFATSMMAAQLLSETGPLVGALAWGYTATLGFALVYLGEHYVVDLLAGAALTTAVRRTAPAAAPALSRFGRAVAALEAVAQGGG